MKSTRLTPSETWNVMKTTSRHKTCDENETKNPENHAKLANLGSSTSWTQLEILWWKTENCSFIESFDFKFKDTVDAFELTKVRWARTFFSGFIQCYSA